MLIIGNLFYYDFVPAVDFIVNLISVFSLLCFLEWTGLEYDVCYLHRRQCVCTLENGLFVHLCSILLYQGMWLGILKSFLEKASRDWKIFRSRKYGILKYLLTQICILATISFPNWLSSLDEHIKFLKGTELLNSLGFVFTESLFYHHASVQYEGDNAWKMCAWCIVWLTRICRDVRLWIFCSSYGD